MRLVALLILSVAGLLVALAFARFSAPDLALTQLSVEVVTMVLLMLALYFLPSRTPAESSSLRGLRDVALASGVGMLVALLAYAVLTRPYESIADSSSRTASPGRRLQRGQRHPGGLPWFRYPRRDQRAGDRRRRHLRDARRFRPAQADLRPAGSQPTHAKHPLILETLSRVPLPLALLISVFIFLRGHNLPGGGFIAGLVTAIALVLQYIASGSQWVEQRLPLNYAAMAGAGVLIAGLTGLGSWLFGYPFLTSAFGHFELPLIGEIELATAMLFDLGVYLTVVGAALLILSYLGKLSLMPEPVAQEERRSDGSPVRHHPRPAHRQRRLPAAAGEDFPVVLGLTLISYAVNLFLFAMGRLGGSVAVIGTPGEYGDPLPQALVLTAIVIGFAMTAFVVVLALRGLGDLGSDHVDGRPDEEEPRP